MLRQAPGNVGKRKEQSSTMLTRARPSFRKVITPERYAIIKATMLYNSYGLYEDGADVTDESTILSEPTRCAKSSASPFGAALFFVSSYIQHDAVANVELSFLCRDSKQPFIVAKAARDIAANEPLSTRYFAGKMEGKQGAIWSNANEALTEE